jgi:hypothetical protein
MAPQQDRPPVQSVLSQHRAQLPGWDTLPGGQQRKSVGHSSFVWQIGVQVPTSQKASVPQSLSRQQSRQRPEQQWRLPPQSLSLQQAPSRQRPPQQTKPPSQVPQLRVPPQPSETVPQTAFWAAQVVVEQPQTFATPPPPQVCGAEHVPQSTVPPQPSGIESQFLPCAAQIVAAGTGWQEPDWHSRQGPQEVPSVLGSKVHVPVCGLQMPDSWQASGWSQTVRSPETHAPA